MKIEHGKFYRTRDGQKVGPMVRRYGDAYPWTDGDITWTHEGKFYQDGAYGVDSLDLIAEWTDALPYGHARLSDGRVVDLTAIEKPFGLLSDEIQAALKAQGGPYDYFGPSGEWHRHPDPVWLFSHTYRLSPIPPAPREYWIVDSEAYKSNEAAREASAALLNPEIVHVIEKT